MFKKKPRNTDTILRDVSLMITELEEGVGEHASEAARQQTIMNDAEVRREQALYEQERAGRVAAKFAELIQ